jgi:hypothetical protein
MFNPEAALNAGLELVGTAVQDIHNRGRRALAAALKPEMQRRNPQFDERLLGFTSFRAFLKEAEGRGIIKLIQTPAGHLEAFPPEHVEERQVIHLQTRPSQRARLIRRDLWACFMDWTPGWRRVYNTELREAVMFPEEETPFDRRDHREARTLWRAHPERFRDIDPIGSETQRAWIREFGESIVDAVARTYVLAVAQSSQPFRDFGRALRTLPGLSSHWHQFRIGKVAEAIDAWTARNGLDLDYWEPQEPSVEGGAGTSSAPSGQTHADESGSGMPNEAAVRLQVHAIVDRLPLSELLQLRLPLAYTLSQ